MAREQYMRQVELLVRTLPFIARHNAFALKGGTAINLFYRDMPRLSVDIDLVYLPIEDRETTLKGIDATLERIREDLQPQSPRCHGPKDCGRRQQRYARSRPARQRRDQDRDVARRTRNGPHAGDTACQSVGRRGLRFRGDASRLVRGSVRRKAACGG